MLEEHYAGAMDEQLGDDPPDRLYRLFSELEGEFDEGLRLEDEQAAVEAIRAQVGETALWEWLARRVGWSVVVRAAGRVLHGTLAASYQDFCVLQGDGEASHLVRLGPATSISVPAGQHRDLQPAPRTTAVQYRLALALRELARRREPVGVVLLDGDEVGGTIEAVGRDFVEVAEHDPGEARREAVVRARRLVSLEALALVSLLPDHR